MDEPHNNSTSHSDLTFVSGGDCNVEMINNAMIAKGVDISTMPAGQYTIKIIQVAEKKAIVCHTKKELTVSQF